MVEVASAAGHRSRSGSIGGAFHKSPNRTLAGGEHDPAPTMRSTNLYPGARRFILSGKGEMPCVHANCWLDCSRS